MGAPSRPAIRFGDYTLDPDQRLLFRGGGPVPLPPKVLDVLLVLVEGEGRVVQKKDLMERVWPDTFVEEANLSVHVSTLRKVLGDASIETVPKRGYRFALAIEAAPGAPAAADTPSHHRYGPIAAAAALLLVLAAVAGVRALVPRRTTLALLPFANPSRNEVAGQLVDGLGRSLASRLAALGPRVELKALQPDAPGDDALGAARRARADVSLGGRIIQRQQEWVIQAELTDVASHTVLWTAEYGGQTLTSVYAVEDRIVGEVAHHLPVTLSPSDLAGLERHRPKSPEAAALAERADTVMFQLTPSSLRRSIEYAEKAIVIDPTYGLPYGQIASAYSLLGRIDALPPEDAGRQADEWRRKALAVDADLYTSHITRLADESRSWDWSTLERAGALHPFYDDFLVASGRLDEALARSSAPSDHSDPILDLTQGDQLYYARKYEQAADRYRRALELEPGLVVAHLGLGRALLQQEQYRQAIDEFGRAADMPRAEGALGHAYAVSGRRADARRLLGQLARIHDRYVSPLNLAWIHLGLGDREDAFRWLERACALHLHDTAYLKVDPIYDPLRSDPRFHGLLACVGFGR